ncbi:MAG: hypothetical protein HFE76_14470 [Firmicutes bacterium]|nr:hypothetical protein [Bacillota bacterium]
MKKNINFVLYAIALIIILIPVVMTEVIGRPIGQPWESITLSLGLLILLAGKIITIRRKRTQTGESVFQDLIISICLVVMIGWLFLR